PRFRFLIAPLIQVLEDEHAQQHFHWRRVPPMDQGETIAFPKVTPDLLIQLVIVEQSVQLSQHRIGLLGQLGNLRKHIFSFILVNKHFRASLPLFCRFLLLSSIHVSSPAFVARQPAPSSLLLGFSLHSAMLAQKTSACQAASQAHFAMQTSTRISLRISWE